MRGVNETSGSGLPPVSDVWFPPRDSTLARAGKLLFSALVAAYFAICFGAHGSFLNLALYTQGLAMRPYQYRVLPMFAFRLLMRSSILLGAARHAQAFNNDPYRLILTGIAFTAMIGAMYATRLTIELLTRDRVFAFWASFLVAFMSLLDLAPSFGLNYTVPYDVPALFFFALGMYFILSGRRWAFHVLFPFAVLNRETACFISVFFAIWEWTRLAAEGTDRRTRMRRIAPAVAVQIVVWFAIKLYLVRVFSQNPMEGAGNLGGVFTNQLAYNLHEIVKPQQWPILLSICGFSLPFLYLQRRWIRCDGMYFSCGIILPIYLAGMMIAGIIVEIRIFTEWIALVVPAVALIIHNRFRPVPEPVAGIG